MVNAPEVGFILRVKHPLSDHTLSDSGLPQPHCGGSGDRQCVLLGHAGRVRGVNLVLPPLQTGSRRARYGMGSKPPPNLRCRVHRKGHGKPRTGWEGEREVVQGTTPGRSLQGPRRETTPEREAPRQDRWEKRRVQRHSPPYVRWRIGGSTRGGHGPPRHAGKPRTGGSAEVERQS